MASGSLKRSGARPWVWLGVAVAVLAALVVAYTVASRRPATTELNEHGVSVVVVHPRQTSGGVSGEDLPDGWRRVVYWTEGGQRREVEIRVEGQRLYVGGTGYGPLAQGDRVTVDGTAVSVNGELRHPVATTRPGGTE